MTAAAAARRPSGRPTAAGAAELSERILKVATRAFLTHGYAATSIETIAATAGVAKRTLYARWRDKPALFRAVLERLMVRWLAMPEPSPPKPLAPVHLAHQSQVAGLQAPECPASAADTLEGARPSSAAYRNRNRLITRHAAGNCNDRMMSSLNLIWQKSSIRLVLNNVLIGSHQTNS